MKRPEDIEEVMHISLLGVIPNLEKIKVKEENMAKLELSEQRLHSVKKAEEYYNALRTNIQLSGDGLKSDCTFFGSTWRREVYHFNQYWPGLLRVQVIRHFLLMPIFVIQSCQESSSLEKELQV